MGNSKSQEFSSLISKYTPEDWIILQQKDTFQVWSRRTDSKRFMAYPINETEINSEEKLQLYNFRKLNHGNLVAIDSIQSHEDQYLCSLPKNKYVLVENIPYRLSHFNQGLYFYDGLTILSAVFAGYNTLNYVYGPLFTSQQMIGFTESGVPKVWVNQNFSFNDPCLAALNGADEVSPTSIEQKTYCCVQKVLDIVEVSIRGGYPLEFKAEANQVTSFAEGEELVDNYCRRKGIILDERVALKRKVYVEPLRFQSQTHLRSSRPSLNTYIRTNPNIQSAKPTISTNFITTQVSSQHPITSLQTPSQSIVLNKPNLRVSINGTKINFAFNGVQIPQNKIISIPEQQTGVEFTQIAVTQRRQNEQILTKQAIPIITQQPANNPVDQKEFIEEKSCFNQEELVSNSLNERHQINTVQSKEEIMIHTPKVVHENQEQNQQQYQLMVHQVCEQENINEEVEILVENNRLPTSQSVEEQGMIMSNEVSTQPIDELKKWEQSLMKLSERQKKNYEQKLVSKNKPFYQSQSQQYLSQERDKVLLEPSNPIQEFNNLYQLQSYIRNKYKQYLSTPQNQPSSQHQSQYYDSNKYFNYTEDYHPPICQPLPLQENEQRSQYPQYKVYEEQSDQRKYTFGKIQLDPIPANNQYSKAKQKQRRPSAFRSIKLKEGRKYEQSSLQQKYSKYVKNKEHRTSILQSKELSSIVRAQESIFNTNKKDYLLNEYLQESFREIEKPTPKLEKNNLTYDKLRELLWA